MQISHTGQPKKNFCKRHFLIYLQLQQQASSHYCLSVVLEGFLAERRDKIILDLRDAGIGTSIYYPHPIPRLSYYVQKYGYDPSRVSCATAISDCSIALPVGPHLDEEDVDFVATEFERVVGAQL